MNRNSRKNKKKLKKRVGTIRIATNENSKVGKSPTISMNKLKRPISKNKSLENTSGKFYS